MNSLNIYAKEIRAIRLRLRTVEVTLAALLAYEVVALALKVIL